MWRCASNHGSKLTHFSLGQANEDLEPVLWQLQQEFYSLSRSMEQLLLEHNQQQLDIQQLNSSVEQLQNQKAGKETSETEIGSEEDTLSSRNVDMKTLRRAYEELHDTVDKLMGQGTSHEESREKMLKEMDHKLTGKLDRMELDSYKEDVYKCCADIKQKMKEMSGGTTQEAAGLRKQLLKSFHCMSCDRPLQVAIPSAPVTCLPLAPALPTRQSSRPSTIYERGYSCFLNPKTDVPKTSGVEEFQMLLPSARNCGGSHTMLSAYRRSHVTPIFPPISQDVKHKASTGVKTSPPPPPSPPSPPNPS
uniref:DUF4795 domain-containing protein n=1 Tax=Eptatretus burgeri TaxID=7764 RepID=A0A8C4NFR6_EPTBU